MKHFRRLSLSLLGIGVVACDRAKAPPPVDSVKAIPVSPADSAIAATTRNWNASAGPVLLVVAGSPSQAFVVAPDSATAAEQLANIPKPASVTLFGRGGTVQTADLPSLADSNGCAIGTLGAAPPPRAWSVGFIGGVIAPVAMDSTESLSRADSAKIVVEMTRLASALPNDSAGRFSGLPFIVRSVWRFKIPDGPTVVIATLSRQVNQEATPLQERTLLVAEESPADSTYSTAYSERTSGPEETIESQDVLGAVLIGTVRSPALVLSRDDGDSVAYGLVERGENGRWSPRWRSARRRC
jgi:hypothetical protein